MNGVFAMKLSDALLMIKGEFGYDDPVGIAVDELYHMLDMALPEYLEEDLPNFSPSVDDLDMVLFDLADALAGVGNSCFSGIVALLQGLAHLKMSQDGSESETTWVHDDVAFHTDDTGRGTIIVPFDSLRCPACGEQQECNSGSLLHYATICQKCNAFIEPLVVAVTLHVMEEPH
jgi:hypothetical protein